MTFGGVFKMRFRGNQRQKNQVLAGPKGGGAFENWPAYEGGGFENWPAPKRVNRHFNRHSIECPVTQIAAL